MSIKIEDIILSNNIVVFYDSNSTDQFKRIKSILKDYKVESLFVLKLDKDLLNSESRDYLIKITGTSQVSFLRACIKQEIKV